MPFVNYHSISKLNSRQRQRRYTYPQLNWLWIVIIRPKTIPALHQVPIPCWYNLVCKWSLCEIIKYFLSWQNNQSNILYSCLYQWEITEAIETRVVRLQDNRQTRHFSINFVCSISAVVKTVDVSADHSRICKQIIKTKSIVELWDNNFSAKSSIRFGVMRNTKRMMNRTAKHKHMGSVQHTQFTQVKRTNLSFQSISIVMTVDVDEWEQKSNRERNGECKSKRARDVHFELWMVQMQFIFSISFLSAHNCSVQCSK